ncbi:hypothetical protein MUK42_35370 [Musa troglodytarum]|uniref:Uncharacterized protein n=1 Tax=Musa troglodytarum TaxID=320322 RepID=A0A9E7GJ11_9LILI|nr:hypothetical protein MUK42_35370 [Musa troglodytarum]
MINLSLQAHRPDEPAVTSAPWARRQQQQEEVGPPTAATEPFAAVSILRSVFFTPSLGYLPPCNTFNLVSDEATGHQTRRDNGKATAAWSVVFMA